jgi:hypothetical protein
MCEHDTEMKNLLGSAAMNDEPDPVHMQATRERMMQIACSRPATGSARRTVLTLSMVLVGMSAVGVAATQTGRDFIRWIFTPIETPHIVTGQMPSESPNEDGMWTVTSNRPEPFTAQETEDIRARMTEVGRIRLAGGGRLAGLFEGPNPDGSSSQWTSFNVEYTLADGRTRTVGEGGLSTKQKASMRVDEILKLRDAGAGEIVSQSQFPIGLGKYIVRFTLSDGQTVDLVLNYPPGTRQEREKIFAETRALKQQLRFKAVDSPSTNPDGSVWGLLHYTLSDGRVVGIVEEVPKGAITPDGTHVAVPATEPTTAP